MKIVLDRNIRAAGQVFEKHGAVTALDGRHITPGDVKDADALIIRSVTRVNRELLQGSRVKFVGTTTIGTDHLDTDWLEANGIAWANAPGCNADAAAQYTLAMIWLACSRLSINPARLSYGVIGLGNVGSRLKRLLEAIGAPVFANDPPLAGQGVSGLSSLEQVLAADVVSLHVPLIREGPWPTFQMIAAESLAQMSDGALLVNAARGDVVCEQSLLEELRAGRLHAALDVWPNEPRLSDELLDRSVVATPHVAGYSDDGRRNGAWMIYHAFCDQFSLASEFAPMEPDKSLIIQTGPSDTNLGPILERCCFVSQHDQAMRQLLKHTIDERARDFDRLRRDYPPRRDFQAWHISGANLEFGHLCRNLGFSIEPIGV